MKFSDIASGTQLFLDANTFVYHIVSGPTLQMPCENLLERITQDDIAGFTCSDVLSDVAHRLMTYEAADLYGWPMPGIVYKLQQQPDKVKSLAKFRQAIEDIPKFGVQVLAVEVAHVVAAAALSQQHGLLSGDALIAAVMQANNLTNIASNDADFDRVPGINRYAPA
jgi:predicted nucleic acid-binding protein